MLKNKKSQIVAPMQLDILMRTVLTIGSILAIFFILTRLFGFAFGDIDTTSPQLKEAIMCASYRCSEGCDEVNNMDFPNLEDEGCQCDDISVDGKVCKEEGMAYPVVVDIGNEGGTINANDLDKSTEGNLKSIIVREDCEFHLPISYIVQIDKKLIDERTGDPKKCKLPGPSGNPFDCYNELHLVEGRYYIYGDMKGGWGDMKEGGVVICSSKLKIDVGTYKNPEVCYGANLPDWLPGGGSKEYGDISLGGGAPSIPNILEQCNGKKSDVIYFHIGTDKDYYFFRGSSEDTEVSSIEVENHAYIWESVGGKSSVIECCDSTPCNSDGIDGFLIHPGILNYSKKEDYKEFNKAWCGVENGKCLLCTIDLEDYSKTKWYVCGGKDLPEEIIVKQKKVNTGVIGSVAGEVIDNFECNSGGYWTNTQE